MDSIKSCDNNHYKEYLYVLDYSDSTICEIELDDKDDEADIEAIFDRRGLKTSMCAWLFKCCKITNIITLKPNE